MASGVSVEDQPVHVADEKSAVRYRSFESEGMRVTVPFENVQALPVSFVRCASK